MFFWYHKSIWQIILWPFHLLLSLLVWLRFKAYKKGILKSAAVQLPVIIVGNISVGGTGKSPLVQSLVSDLKRQGFRPAIISRGYGGKAENYPLEVTQDSDVKETGDEAWMLANRCECPVVVDPIRTRAVDLLATTQQCDVVISDDGLQHYQLPRQFEVIVVEAERYLGNELLMPFGPLREPAWRMHHADAVVINHRFDSNTALSETLRHRGLTTYDCHFSAKHFKQLHVRNLHLSWQSFVTQFRQQRIHAVAGIGNPEAFYNYLRSLGLSIITHSYPDHHEFTEQDLRFDDGIIVMTEKDASKCRDFEIADIWYLVIENHITPNLTNHCLKKLELQRETI